MIDLPRGTVTFLFTDIEGSTRMWHAYPDAMPAAYERHDTILRAAVFSYGGIVYKTIGDAFQIAFPDAASGIGAVLDAQRALQAEPWPTPEPINVRMALHTGAVDPNAEGDYRSPVLNRLGRLLGAAHGEQVLVSQAAMELARDHLPPETSLIDLGEQRLKDLFRPERIWQLSHPALRVAYPPLRTLDTRPNNLPPQLTQFIGREDDVAAVLALLRRDDVRLVTLTGPGGIGKTRLSLQAAADALDHFTDGVYQVVLDTVTDPTMVPEAIAQALGIRDTGESPAGSLLTGYLRDRRMLIILDNLEQVVEVASYIGDLLVAAPGIKIVATSRIRLQIRGEHEYPVRPFALPDLATARNVSAISQFESVRLFLERAEASRPTFQVTAENAPAIAEICHRLDGLPLAIELAAARIRVLPPDAMLSRLTARLPILTGGSRNLPARQQTLRGAIAWSYELLTPEDQALYRRLAVFSGGATIDAIEAVVGGNGQDLDLLDVLDGLERLVDHSLLRQDETHGEPRFRMFETIREYGLERLDEQEETDEIHRRHAAWVCDLVSEFRIDLSAETMADWLKRTDAEQDNVRAALAWALDHDATLAVRIAGFAGRYWQWRSHYREGGDWLGRVLAIDASAVPALDRARALRVGSVFQEAMGHVEEAMASLRESERLFIDIGEPAEAAFAHSVIGILIADTGSPAAALKPLREAVDLARNAGNTAMLVGCLNNLASILVDTGDVDLAHGILDEALALSANHSGLYASTVMHSVAELCTRTGDFARAEAMFKQSLRDSLPGELTDLILANLMGLVLAAIGQERWHDATRMAGTAAALRQVGDVALAPDLSYAQNEYEQQLTKARDALGEEAFKENWAAGAAMPLQDVIADVFAEEPIGRI